jgi:predicted Zn finger-like uncharacterized protein
MVITCPSCSARYRLNPDKIKGRGAKITCPKCTHIFVVFSDQASRSTPGVASPHVPSIGKGPDTAGELLARRDRELTTGAFKAVGIEEGDDGSLTASGKIRVVAPGPRKTRRRSATTIDSSASLDAIRSASMSGVSNVPPTEEGLGGGEITAADIPDPKSASELDFREVGITTWKVKVAIGLIYDFSDISTLKKYLADKKVTEDDLISHDAKSWVRIGEIGDLDRHFIEKWKIAKAEKIARGSSVKNKKPSAAGTTSSSQLSAVGSSAGTGSFANPAAGGLAGSGQARARPRRKKAVVEEEKKNYAPMVLAAIVVLGVGAYFAFGRPVTPPSSAAAGGEAATLAPPKDIDEAERERIRDRIREDMRKQREDIAAQETPAEPMEVVLENVIPPSARRVPERTRGKLPSPLLRPPGRSSVTPSPVSDSTPARGGSFTTTEKIDTGGKMWADQAQKKLDAGNYGSAKDMINKAIKKDPNKAAYQRMLGEILEKLGEPEAAAVAFSKAESLG